MNTFHRVMYKETEISEPELWTNYADPGDAAQAAQALMDEGYYGAWVVPVSSEPQTEHYTSPHAQLIEPDGALNLTTSIDDAIAYCSTHPGWSWQLVD